MRILLTLAFILISTTSNAAVISGTATVHDGDTIRINDTRIRIWGIDAAELKQQCGNIACGKQARETLRAFIGTNSVTCTPKGKSYDRIVATCTVNGEDIGSTMIRAGMALDAKRYSRGFYNNDETKARNAALGLWSMDFQNPAAWRACRHKGRCE